MSQATLFNCFLFFGGAILCIAAFGWCGGIGVAMLAFFARSEN